MRALIPDRITGKVQILIGLADNVVAGPLPLMDLVTLWVRAVEVGLFGPGWIRLQGDVGTRGNKFSWSLECEQISQAAFHALARMIQRFPKVKGRVQSMSIDFEDGQSLFGGGGLAIPALPESIPFAVEYHEDIHSDVRIEIEFRNPLAQADRQAIFDALSVWDALIDALGTQERWTERVDSGTRLLSPAIVEHEVFGYYFDDYECLNFIVLLGLSLNQRLIIERITFE